MNGPRRCRPHRRAIRHPAEGLAARVGEDSRLWKIEAAALAIEDGRELWHYVRPPGGRYAWPAMDERGDVLYLACGDGTLVAIDAATGREKRRLKVGTDNRLSGLLCRGKSLLWIERSGLRCLDLPSLRMRWRRDLDLDHDRSVSQGYPAGIEGDTVCCYALKARRIHALDLATGQPRWEHAVEASPRSEGFLVTPRRVLYSVGRDPHTELV